MFSITVCHLSVLGIFLIFFFFFFFFFKMEHQELDNTVFAYVRYKCVSHSAVATIGCS